LISLGRRTGRYNTLVGDYRDTFRVIRAEHMRNLMN